MRPQTPGTILNAERNHWLYLTVLWAVWYLAIFTIGDIPAYTRKVIWGGFVVVAAFSLPYLMSRLKQRDWPAEGWLLLGFSVWTLTGLAVASDYAAFMHYVRQIAELAFIVLFVAAILKYSGQPKWFYIAFLLVAVFQVFYRDLPVNLAQLQQQERVESSNSLGIHSLLGLIAMFALWGETRKLIWRILIAGCGILALYGLILSASRGAFAGLIVLVVLWSTLCLVGSRKRKLAGMAGMVIVMIAGYHIYDFVVQETYMGTRYQMATQMEDRSTQTRMGLAITGLRLLARSPIIGHGVGQFGVASGTGKYAHNEFAEIAATTGLPGLLLHYSVYLMALKRLARLIYYAPNSMILYRLNMARVILLVLLVVGALSRPNFISQNTMFMLAVSIGIAHWAERLLSSASFPPAQRYKRTAITGAPLLNTSAKMGIDVRVVEGANK